MSGNCGKCLEVLSMAWEKGQNRNQNKLGKKNLLMFVHARFIQSRMLRIIDQKFYFSFDSWTILKNF